MMAVPSSAEAAAAVQEVRRLYGRTLSCWAVDVLKLRRDGTGLPMWNSHAAKRVWRKAA